MRALALLALCATLGCHTTSFPAHTVRDDPAQRAELHGRLMELRPPARSMHRAIFVRGRDQVALTMYTDYQAPDSMKIAAVSDLGTTVFQLELTSTGVNVLHETSAFPASFLENYLLPDLLAVYAIPPVADCQLVQVELGEGATALAWSVIDPLGSSRVLAYDSGSAQLQQYQRGRDGEVLSELELSTATPARAGEPARIQLHLTSAAAPYTANLVITPWTEQGG